MTGKIISGENRAFFEKQGYLIMPSMFDMGLCRVLRAFAIEELEKMAPPLEYELDLNYPGAPNDRRSLGAKTVRRILQAASRNPKILAVAKDTELCAAIGSLFKAQNGLMLSQNHHNCIMTKDARFSSDTLWHQDIRYWSFSDDNLISAWIALGPEFANNGGLKVLPGSHLTEFSPSSFDSDLFFRTDSKENKEFLRGELQITLNAGDVFLFHSRLLHAANRNRSDETKLSLVFTYYDESNSPQKGTRSDYLPPIQVR